MNTDNPSPAGMSIDEIIQRLRVLAFNESESLGDAHAHVGTLAAELIERQHAQLLSLTAENERLRAMLSELDNKARPLCHAIETADIRSSALDGDTAATATMMSDSDLQECLLFIWLNFGLDTVEAG